MSRLQISSPNCLPIRSSSTFVRNWLGGEYLSSWEGVLMTTTKTKLEYFCAIFGLMENASLAERECWWLQLRETSSRTQTQWVGLRESPWVGCVHEMCVLFLSKIEKEHCVPLCGVRKAMSWVCGSSLRWRWNIVCPCVGWGSPWVGCAHCWCLCHYYSSLHLDR